MDRVLASLVSVVLSVLMVWFVVLAAATSAPPTSPPPPSPAPAATTTTATPPPSLLPFSLFVSSPLPSLTIANPTLPTAPLSENGCVAKSLRLSSDCKFAFDAMQESVDSRGGEGAGAQLKTLATALAVQRAARSVGAAASERCSSSADGFFGSGCACEPAIVVGLKFVDVVPPVAKRELMEIAKRCPTTTNDVSPPTTSLAAGIAALQDFLDSKIVSAAGGNGAAGGGSGR